MKRILPLFLLFLLLPFSACSSPKQMGAPKLTVTFLSVGKADCILLESNTHAALIDTGKNKNGDDILSLLSEKGISSLDFLLLTHMDKDHIGGADTVLTGIPVGTVYAPAYIKDSKQFTQYAEALASSGLTPTSPSEPLSLSFGSCEIDILPPSLPSYDQSNDYSILLRLTCGKISFLFTGDAEDVRLNEYLSASPDPMTVLKIPHHGNLCDTSRFFLTTVTPKVAVITDSDKDPADPELLSLLQSLKITTYETKSGTVTIQTDGNSYTITQ